MKEFNYIKKKKIMIDVLNFQYIPKIFCKDIWHTHTAGGSPHVRFLQTYMKYGYNYSRLLKTDYAEQFRRWDQINFLRGCLKRRDNEYIKFKIDRFISLFRKIKKNGYDLKKHIIVLEEPFWETRYNEQVPFSGYEVWHGHHRIACCYILEHKAVYSMILRDNLKGKKHSKFNKQLRNIKNDK